MSLVVYSGLGQPRWGWQAGGGLGPRAQAGLCPYTGYGQTEGEVARQEFYEERLTQATEAALVAASQAEINAALAAQAQEFNHSIIVGFIGAGAVSVLMWGLAQAIFRSPHGK